MSKPTPLHELSSRKAMRIAYCFHCHSLTKVEAYEGPHEYDQHMQRWIDEHLHGMSVEEHPGGRFFTKEASNFDHSGEAGDAIEEQMVEEVRAELAQANLEVYAMRDSVKEDAVKCHRKHGQPSWPGKPCVDYRGADKALGRQDVPEEFRQFQCTYCPYEETVNFEKRWRRGMYK
jgi:hypothetical protein